MELSRMTAMEAKLDAIMHRMDKQESKTHTADSCHSRVIRNQQNLYPKFLLLP